VFNIYIKHYRALKKKVAIEYKKILSDEELSFDVNPDVKSDLNEDNQIAFSILNKYDETLYEFL
jgi:hypothetical protein